MKPKYPHIKVKLTGKDGNAFFILGAVQKAMERSDVPPDQTDLFMTEAKSGDYDNLLRTAMKWVNVT